MTEQLNNLKGKKLLLQGASRGNLGFVKTAKRHGVYVVMTGLGGDFPCNPYADKFCKADISISWNVGIGGANHDYNRVTQHAFLYAPQFGMLEPGQPAGYDRFETLCEIGNDVWIGCNAVICRETYIGDGAGIGAGAVVTKDVEPYTIVGGVPAKVIKRRCPMELARRLQAVEW